ncbi:uncharacterized protein LOC123260992 [Cotesia glomerata]|uniref:Uncharacterized protein n=1 Tax=Cotesia glomerata TaxID=32391 RepID=A0AAV7IEL0_COTGL|nr:uncharacterized protein LOC123260992 [Cotesia glomerata]KAH0549548.1 hypothetical protein KQX54_010279 [Cotesia glomerata]
MFLRAFCIVAFFGLLNVVHSAAENSEEQREEILNAQEEATIKVLTASLKAEEAAKLNFVLETKVNDYYTAGVNSNDYKLKVELVRRITDGKKKRLENSISELAGKTDEEALENLALTKNLIEQIEEMEKLSDQQIKNLTDVELAAKLEWETFYNETQNAVKNAEEMKKDAVKAVIAALELTANCSELGKIYPKLTTRDAAQKACVDYFKNRLLELVPGLSDSSELYERMKKIWIKGQKEFVKAAA